MNTARIDMKVERGDMVLTIIEDLPGWFMYTQKLKDVFPAIVNDWDITIMFPAFEKNYRTIYERVED